MQRMGIELRQERNSKGVEHMPRVQMLLTLFFTALLGCIIVDIIMYTTLPFEIAFPLNVAFSVILFYVVDRVSKRINSLYL